MYVKTLIIKGDEHIMSSDSDDSSSGEESDSMDDKEESMDTAPAVPDVSTQPSTKATTCTFTPIGSQLQDVFPIFRDNKKGRDSSAEQRSTPRSRKTFLHQQ